MNQQQQQSKNVTPTKEGSGSPSKKPVGQSGQKFMDILQTAIKRNQLAIAKKNRIEQAVENEQKSLDRKVLRFNIKHEVSQQMI